MKPDFFLNVVGHLKKCTIYALIKLVDVSLKSYILHVRWHGCLH